ncbi:MAG: hypothetical protein V3U39_00730 [Acidimicrobiia bacterium]
MAWWVLELIVTLLLVAILFVLGPVIKRFRKSYAADIFRANPRTGKSYLVLWTSQAGKVRLNSRYLRSAPITNSAPISPIAPNSA